VLLLPATVAPFKTSGYSTKKHPNSEPFRNVVKRDCKSKKGGSSPGSFNPFLFIFFEIDVYVR
jgi:hypothetical protein